MISRWLLKGGTPLLAWVVAAGSEEDASDGYTCFVIAARPETLASGRLGGRGISFFPISSILGHLRLSLFFIACPPIYWYRNCFAYRAVSRSDCGTSGEEHFTILRLLAIAKFLPRII